MYTQLTQEERYQIHALLKAGHNPTEIAEVLGRHKPTISRELRRNRGRRVSPARCAPWAMPATWRSAPLPNPPPACRKCTCWSSTASAT